MSSPPDTPDSVGGGRERRRSRPTAVWREARWAVGEDPADCHGNVESCHDTAIRLCVRPVMIACHDWAFEFLWRVSGEIQTVYPENTTF